jgi:hypothetical protein
MRVTAADDIEACRDILFRRVRILVDEHFSIEHYAADTKAALDGLQVHKSLLDRMRIVRRPQSLDSHNLVSDRSRRHSDTGPHWLPIQKNRTGATLSETAAELGTIQLKVITKYK